MAQITPRFDRQSISGPSRALSATRGRSPILERDPSARVYACADVRRGRQVGGRLCGRRLTCRSWDRSADIDTVRISIRIFMTSPSTAQVVAKGYTSCMTVVGVDAGRVADGRYNSS